ncbi:MAG: hypothetical protein IJA97_05125 [Clostridia bacterium]|nr:hypothetical protein [Clostridia bacterium]
MKENVKLSANAIIGINDLALKGEIVVFGSTYMAGFPLYEFIKKYHFENAIYNRSIAGLTTSEALEIVQDCIISIRPSKIFIALGEEDENNVDAIKDYNQIIKLIQSALPKSKIYLICLQGNTPYVERFNANIRYLCDNKKIFSIRFISSSSTETGAYKAQFKQLSCFFRNKPLTMVEAFARAN